MFCPRCGQERISQETSFCSRCGFLLTAAAELLSTGGALVLGSPPARGGVGGDGISPRRRGIRWGLFMFLLMFVLAPLIGIILEFAVGNDPWPVGVVILVLGGGGLLRIAYALFFESKYPAALAAGTAPHIADGLSLGVNPTRPALGDVAATEYTAPQGGRWLETTDLEPSSVTEQTTRLLEKEK